MTFFNEKGGSGKSTLCAMMASWLRYACGESVGVIDFDHPMYSVSEMRDLDLEVFSQKGRELMRFVPPDAVPERDWYPVYRTDRPVMGPSDLQEMAAFMRMLSRDTSYLLLDFPGSFTDGDAVTWFMQKGLLDLMAVPVYTDRNVLLSALNVCGNAGAWGQDTAVLWNRVTRSERTPDGRDRLEPLSGLFTARGIPVLDARIPDLTMMRRDCRTWRFLRSTACWPQANADLLCPEAESAFREIRRILDSKTIKP